VGREPAGRADVEHAVIAQSGDLAYTVGFERGPASVAGGPSQELVIRVTQSIVETVPIGSSCTGTPTSHRPISAGPHN
jgi:hypothetical protein